MGKNSMFVSGLPGREVIHFRCNHKMECIFLTDITYIKSDGSYSNIYMKGDNQRRMICKNLKNIHIHLIDYGFLRCSRSLLVNSKHIAYFCSERKTVLVNNVELSVSIRIAKKVFRELLEIGIKDTESFKIAILDSVSV